MKMKRLLNLFLILAALLSAGSACAQKVSVKAKLDSVQLLMGNMTLLHLEVVQNQDATGGFEIFKGAQPDGIVGVCGDSVELRTSIRRDTLDLGSRRIQINYQVPVQAFDSGFYRLPEFVYVSGNDTARSNRVSLKVVPVNVSENDAISDYAGVAEPEGKSIFDALPDPLIDLWWLWLLIILLAAITLYGWQVYKKRGSILPKKPEPTPYEAAMKALKDLKARQLWEKGMEREYFTRLTDILRVYLEKRFGINAMEMTTNQIISTLADNTEVKEKRGYMREILDIADFVKFARVRPLPADNIASYENAVKFVEETKPVEPAEEEKDGESAENEEKKGGAK